MILVSFIFLNLFIAIIIDRYNISQKSEELPIGEATIEDFQNIWVKFDKKGEGFISVLQIRKLLDLLLRREVQLMIETYKEDPETAKDYFMFNLMADQQLGYVFADMYEKKVGDELNGNEGENSIHTDPEVDEAAAEGGDEEDIHR